MPEYSDNQMHGESFENMIKAANGIFSWAAADRRRSSNDRFDIDAKDDRAFGFPTSIKSTRSNIVALSDARLFWQSFDVAPYRMLVGKYRQRGNVKLFDAIHEIILRHEYRAALLGGVSELEIEEFHDVLKSFGVGEEEGYRARAWAKDRKKELGPNIGLVTLNPKIDSGNQRRLQCSIRLSKLIEILDAGDYTIYRERFGTLTLPLQIASGARKARVRPLAQ